MVICQSETHGHYPVEMCQSVNKKHTVIIQWRCANVSIRYTRSLSGVEVLICQPETLKLDRKGFFGKISDKVLDGINR